MAAPTILSERLLRTAPADLSDESVAFLIREKAILELAAKGFSREQSKRLIFEAWRIRWLAGVGR
jgi:hypothetical protein